MQARFDANVLETLSSLKELAYSLVANGLNYMENIKHNEYVFLHYHSCIYTAKITDLNHIWIDSTSKITVGRKRKKAR